MNSQPIQINTNNTALITPEEFNHTLELLQTLKEQPQPSCCSQAASYRVCSRCNVTRHNREIIRPTVEVGIYHPHTTCLHCLAKRCNPDESTLNELKKDFHYLYSNPNYLQDVITKHNEILSKIYNHPTTPLKSLHTQKQKDNVYNYNITL